MVGLPQLLSGFFIAEENMENTLTQGKIFPTLIRFAIPFLLANLLQALYGAADLFMVGQFADAAAIAAVSIGSQVMQTITGIILGLTTGGTVLIGQYWGAHKHQDVAKTIGCILCVFTIMAIILTIIMLLASKPIISFMQTPMEAVSATIQYLLICSSGIIFIVGYNAVSGILRGFGDSTTPLIFVAIACIINIIGDYILVAFFQLGATGAAIATITAQAVSLGLAILYLQKRKLPVPFHKTDIHLTAEKTSKIFRLGFPIALQDGLINISFLIITTIINTMGLNEAAAVGVVEKIIVFAMLPPTAFASAIAAMTAQNMGAGLPQRAKSCMYAGITCSLLFGIAICLYSQWNPASLTAIFADDAEVVHKAALYLKSYSLDCILVCFIFCLNSFFSGCGHSLFSLVHSLLATFALRIPLSYYFSLQPHVTLYQMGLAAPIASLLSIFLCFFYLQSNRWQKYQI